MLGLFTRPTAFILSGIIAVAYFMSHFPRNFYPTLNGGDAAILFCFLFLYISVVGGGSWAFDTFRTSKNPAQVVLDCRPASRARRKAMAAALRLISMDTQNSSFCTDAAASPGRAGVPRS